MKEENGFSYQILVLIIIIVIAVAGVVVNQLIGRNGVIEKVTEVEDKFSKEDVLEKINYMVTQKFIELNNTAKENNQSISDVYNSEVVINFLKESMIISEVYDEDDNLQDGIYDINIEALYSDEETVQVTGSFRLEKVEDKYMVVYYDETGNSQEIGELQIQQMV